MAWDLLTGVDLGADVILTETTMQALYDNATAMARREINTPSFVQPFVREYKVSGTAATWTIPDGVTAFTIYEIGGGDGGEGTVGLGFSGTVSTVTYNAVTYTSGLGGGGDFNAAGGGSVSATTSGFNSGGLAPGFGGASYGVGGSAPSNKSSGSGGGLTIARVVVVAGQTTATYTVGSGGAGGAGGGGDGSAGLIIFEY